MRKFICLFVALFSLFASQAVLAEAEFRIIPTAGGEQKVLSEDQLRQLTQVSVVTSNEYVDGDREFSGPLMRDIFKLCGISRDSTVRLFAADDYEVEIAGDDFFEYDVILALSMDGIALTRRDKGPIWLIYPIKDHKELQVPLISSRLVWQLVSMEY